MTFYIHRTRTKDWAEFWGNMNEAIYVAWIWFLLILTPSSQVVIGGWELPEVGQWDGNDNRTDNDSLFVHNELVYLKSREIASRHGSGG